jgi:hypothetical protein
MATTPSGSGRLQRRSARIPRRMRRKAQLTPHPPRQRGVNQLLNRLLVTVAAGAAGCSPLRSSSSGGAGGSRGSSRCGFRSNSSDVGEGGLQSRHVRSRGSRSQASVRRRGSGLLTGRLGSLRGRPRVPSGGGGPLGGRSGFAGGPRNGHQALLQVLQGGGQVAHLGLQLRQLSAMGHKGGCCRTGMGQGAPTCTRGASNTQQMAYLFRCCASHVRGGRRWGLLPLPIAATSRRYNSFPDVDPLSRYCIMLSTRVLCT